MSSLLQVLIIILGIQWSIVFGARRGNQYSPLDLHFAGLYLSAILFTYF